MVASPTTYRYSNTTSTAINFPDDSTTVGTIANVSRTDQLEGRINGLEYKITMMERDHATEIQNLKDLLIKAIEILKSQGINITELV